MEISTHECACFSPSQWTGRGGGCQQWGAISAHRAGACWLAEKSEGSGCVRNGTACRWEPAVLLWALPPAGMASSTEKVNLGLTHMHSRTKLSVRKTRGRSLHRQTCLERRLLVWVLASRGSPRSPQTGLPTALEQSPPGSPLCCPMHTPPIQRAAWDRKAMHMQQRRRQIHTADCGTVTRSHLLKCRQATEEPQTWGKHAAGRRLEEENLLSRREQLKEH